LEKIDRERIINSIAATLETRDEVVFAYVHGSFLDSPSFRDIDVAVFIDPRTVGTDDLLDLELALGALLRLPYPTDLRVVNSAPNIFKASIGAKGRLLFAKDRKTLGDFLEESSLRTVKDAYIRKESFEALVS